MPDPPARLVAGEVGKEDFAGVNFGDGDVRTTGLGTMPIVQIPESEISVGYGGAGCWVLCAVDRASSLGDEVRGTKNQAVRRDALGVLPAIDVKDGGGADDVERIARDADVVGADDRGEALGELHEARAACVVDAV